jgi:glucosylceramidase
LAGRRLVVAGSFVTAARAGTFALAFALLAAACSKDAAIVAPRGPICPADQVACGQACLGVATDPMNCGGCGIPCATGQICAGGACQCLSGTLCNGSCLPPDAGACSGEIDGTTGRALVTSAPGDYWNTSGQLTEVTAGSASVTIDDAATAQTWEGFGGAFNEKGWSYLALLDPADQQSAMRLLYGADGARFVFGRIPIGASDYALDRYTLDETPGDTLLADFSIDRDMQSLIPYVRAAQAVKPSIRLWASPWTPPTWMKQGPFSSGNAVSPFDGGTMKNDDATLSTFARYLIEFVRRYAQQGITIEAVSPQNEPNYTGTYPTCGWTPATYTTFVGQYLGPAVAGAGLTTKIMLGTFNGGGSDSSIVGSALSDATAGSYVGVVGFQWGMLGNVAGVRSYLPVWQTEHRCGNYPWAKPFDASMAPNDQAYAVESWGLIRDWIRAGVTAYSAWNMVLDTGGVGIDTTRVWPQNALLTVDTSTRTLNVTPAYYVFRHLSQFAAPGAKVVATRGGDALAFKNPDGSVVAVMYNAGSAKTMTVAAAGKELQFAMPANGWATVVTR